MKLDLFNEKDTVLLVGEGNFSFCVELIKHKLPISVTATCFEKEISYDLQEENINFLKSQNVPIFFNVDATKLHENHIFFEKKFSKIIFNFPHVGGKMKVHLNRDLLKNFFKSASGVITKNGLVIISLCKGQGGTPFDLPQRKWEDSWQITEFSGCGGFALVEVTPFNYKNFKSYSCIGYRSQDVKFNLSGALVHIFKKGKIPFEFLNESSSMERLRLIPLNINTNVKVLVLYSEIYANNPMLNSKSSVSFIKDLLIKNINQTAPNMSLEVVLNDDVLKCIDSKTKIQHKINLNYSEIWIYQSGLNNLEVILNFYDVINKKKIFLFPKMFISQSLEKCFLNESPIKFEFLVVGNKILQIVKEYLLNLINVFQEDTLILTESDNFDVPIYPASKILVESNKKLIYKNTKTEKFFVPAIVYFFQYGDKNFEACIIDVNNICQYFFEVKNWRRIILEKNQVYAGNGQRPILKPIVLFPMSYKFDITLRYQKGENFSESKMYETLWFTAGHLIEEVEFLSEFTSQKNWCSKCFRITYRSLNDPLFREHVIKIHSKLVGPALEHALNISIG